MEESVMTAISAGFTSLTDMVKQVVVAGVPASVGVICIAKGAKYGLRWVQGLLGRA